MLTQLLNNHRLILASQSPRRKELIKGLDINYIDATTFSSDESYPASMPLQDVPAYLAQKKSDAYPSPLAPKEILLTADTVVLLNDELLGKPTGREDAIKMLHKISGNRHEVRTAVCLRSDTKSHTFSDTAYVEFSSLSSDEIEYYVNRYQPYDKAGAYGIQEWIGYIGIKRIEGSFYTVMGLPVQRLYEELIKFI